MNLLKAIGAAITAFVDELSPYDFPLLADPGEALECCGHQRLDRDDGFVCCGKDVPVERAGSLAPGTSPEGEVPPASPSGQPNLTEMDLHRAGNAARAYARHCETDARDLWEGLSKKLHEAATAMK